MSNRSRGFKNRGRRGQFESLEPRLPLAVDLSFASAFETLNSPSGSFVSNSAYDALHGEGMVTDNAGNRYVTLHGRGSHSVDLDPGPGINATTLYAALVKLDPSGEVIWKAVFNPTTAASPVIRIFHAVDADQNVYMVGDFRGIVDFDPGPGVVNVASTAGGTDYGFYMAKLNSAGQLSWVRKLDAPELTPFGMELDAAGNLYIANAFTALATDPPMDVDAGPGQVLLQDRGGDSVLLKYTADGNFAWVRQLADSRGSIGMTNIAVAANGDSYVAGSFTGSVDLDPGTGVFEVTNVDANMDGYVARFDAAGNFVSAYTAAGTAEGAHPTFRAIHVASDGSIVVGGHFRGTVDFDPGAGALTLTAVGSSPYVNGFALKLDSELSIQWAKRFGTLTGDGETVVTELDTDHDGNVYIGGSVGRRHTPGTTYDFDPGPDIHEVVQLPGETGYLLSVTDAGDFRWVAPLGGNTGRAQVQGLEVTSDGTVHFSGSFRGTTADFDPDPAEQYLLNNGPFQSVFVGALAQNDPDPGAPMVDAGLPQTILVTDTANLDGTVSDDGLPGPLITTWSKVSGPGTVTFGNVAAVDTTAKFSTSGTYSLLLEATDGQSTTSDVVRIVVSPLSAALTATADTYITDGGNKNKNYGGVASLIVDGKPDNGALLKWDLSSIPAGSTLTSATLSINVTSTSSQTYEIYEVKRSWNEAQATWQKANSATNWQSAGAQGALDRGSTVLGTVTATATGLRTIALNAAGLAVMQGWVNNPATNFGFAIQDYANKPDDDLVFSSRNATVAAHRPQLQVEYNPPNVAPLAGGSGSSVGADALVETAPQVSVAKSRAAAANRVPAEPSNELLLVGDLVGESTGKAEKSETEVKSSSVLQRRNAIDVAIASLGDELRGRWALAN